MSYSDHPGESSTPGPAASSRPPRPVPERIRPGDRLAGERIHLLAPLVEVRHIAVRVEILPRSHRIHHTHTRHARTERIPAAATGELEAFPALRRYRAIRALGNADHLAVGLGDEANAPRSCPGVLCGKLLRGK